MRKKVLVFISVATCYFFVTSILDREQYTKIYTLFFESNIKGRLIYAKIKCHGCAFKVDNDSVEYVFYPNTNKYLNNSHIFYYFAEQGDSIVKPSSSDTLYLIKNDVKYKYLFNKHEDSRW